MIAEGTYRAVAIRDAASWGESSNKHIQVALPFEILRPPGPSVGQRITGIWNFAPGQATEITCQALENAGWDGSTPVQELHGVGEVECEIVVVHETYQGKVRPRIRFVNKPGRGFAFEKAPEQRAMTALDERLARRPRREPSQTPRAQPKSAEHEPDPSGGYYGDEPGGDDDIPF